MLSRWDTMRPRAVRAALASGLGVLAAVVMTWPLAAEFGSLGRVTSDDGRYAIWNVTWVARTLIESPLSLFDANIFYPHRIALAFSEINLVAGIVGIPTWLLTGNPFATHNSALIFAFATSALGAYLLTRRLSGSRAAAAFAAVVFAFAPYFYSHTAHIQLLMGGGIPLSLLMLHRLADAPSARRGLALGVAIAVQGLACAYYGIFTGMMVGYAALFLAASRGLWRDKLYWMSIAIGAVVSIVIVLPFFLPFLQVQESGFHRTLDESRRYSANLSAYLASPANAHGAILDFSVRFGRWTEVLFPGVLAIVIGVAGAALGSVAPRRSDRGGARDRETVWLYGSLGLLILWASFGPAAGLYTVLFKAVPIFSFMRAPSRFGVVIPLVLGVLGSLALARLQGRTRTVASLTLALAAAAEVSVVPFPWEHATPFPSSYRMLAALPRAPMAEFPFYGGRVAFPLHTQYMLFSTAHWQPLLNGYSDHIPLDFRESAVILDSFPSVDSFAVLRRRRVRYIGVHWDMFGPRREEIRQRLQPFAEHLRELAADERMTLYEIVTFPR
jgi:hypothetical protein